MKEIESFGTLKVHFSDVQTFGDEDNYLEQMICEYDITSIEMVLNNGKRIKLQCNEILYNIDRFDLVV